MTKIVSFVFISILFLTACNSSNKNKTEIKNKIEKELEINENLVDDLNKAKQVFYTLPSPIETAMLIKRAGVTYNEKLLNSPDNINNYTTTRDRALNLGVYGADLSYASLFSQTQTTIQYMSVSKKIADEMGILDFLNAGFLDRLEKNINNRDSSLTIITDGFMNSNAYLKEAGQPEIAALIIAGGWLEGLYIATELAKESPNNNELIDRIIDQKISLATLMSLLKDYNDNKDVNYIFNLLADIQKIFNEVQIVTSKVEPVTNNENNVTTLQAKSEVFISDDIFNRLCTKVDSVRNIVTGI